MNRPIDYREYIASTALLAAENMIEVKCVQEFKKLVLAVMYMTQHTKEERQALFIAKTESGSEKDTIEKFQNVELEAYWRGALNVRRKHFRRDVFPKLQSLVNNSSMDVQVMGKIRPFLIEKDLNYVQDLEDLVKMSETINSNPGMPKDDLITMIQKQGVWRGWGREYFLRRTIYERLEFLYEAVGDFEAMDEVYRINDDK